MYCTSVEQLIGKTPLLELTRLEKEFGSKATCLAKLECQNPNGSVKDRASLGMILDAEQKGILKEGSVIIEPTSGNTGIGLCSIASAKKYRTIIVMPDTMSKERRTFMSVYGAELVLTDGKLGMKGAIAKAQELAKAIPNSFIPDQFNNIANARAHYKTTGPEIWEDTQGKVDVFVAGIGSGGTISGVGKFLKEKNSSCEIIGIEPFSSPFLTEGRAGAHKIQGIGAGFEPSILRHPDFQGVMDRVITVKDEDAYRTCREICKKEGVFVGISSGASAYVALTLSVLPKYEGKTIVALLPDSGDRYLSLFGEGDK